VSLNWAGIKSENVASVWLLYHLCDRLSPAQFKELAERVGLAREAGESYGDYTRRIRDDFGVMVNGRTLRALAFETAVGKIGPDLLFDGLADDYDLLTRFHYHLEGETEVKDNERETKLRERIARRSFTAQKKLYDALAGVREWAEGLAGDGGRDFWQNPDGPFFYEEEGGGRLAYGFSPPASGWRRIDAARAARRWLDGGRREGFWDAVLLDGLLRAGTVSRLDEAMEREYRRLSALPAYGPDVLYRLRDFRVLAGLRYVIALARLAGVGSRLEPVLSFPLGSNVVSPLEVARLYETLVTGVSRRSGRDPAGAGLMLIDHIEDMDGEEVYRVKRTSTRVLDAKTSLAIADILRGVVRHGTGRHAYRSIRLHSADPARERLLAELDLPVPTLGKTGTANQFRNSAFAGYVPGVGARGNALTLRHGYAMAAYVGYDDNEPMVRSSTHVTGSTGGLRVWTDVADFIINNKMYERWFDLDALAFAGVDEVPLRYPDLGQARLDGGSGITSVADVDDLLLGVGAGADGVMIGPATIAFGSIDRGGELRPGRFFAPFWRVSP